MVITDWFDQGINIPVPDGRVIHTKVLTYMAELLVVNGGSMTVTHIGRINDVGMYGRTGLELWEAMIFIRMVGTMEGFLLSVDARAGSEAYVAVNMAIQAEINRKKLAIADDTGSIGGALDGDTSKPKPGIILGNDGLLNKLKKRGIKPEGL